MLLAPVAAFANAGIVGTWRIDLVTDEAGVMKLIDTGAAGVPGVDQGHLRAQMRPLVEQMRLALGGATAIFAADGTMKLGKDGEPDVAGTWNMTGGAIVVQVPGDSEPWHASLQGKNLVIVPESQQPGGLPPFVMVFRRG